MINPPSVRTLPDKPIEDVYEEGINKIEKVRKYFRATSDKAQELIPNFRDEFGYCQYPCDNADLLLNHLMWLLKEMEYRVKIPTENPWKQGKLF